MSIFKSEDELKWLNAFKALCGALLAFVSIRLFYQLNEWFDLEAKIPSFTGVAQGTGVLIGVAVFVILAKNKKATIYFSEVYGELIKVVWPEKDGVSRLTVGILIGVAIVSGILVLVDYLFRLLLSFIY